MLPCSNLFTVDSLPLKLNEIMIGNYLQKENKAPSKVGLGFQMDRAS
jgi:hypothetical protein